MERKTTESDYSFKIVIVGDSGVGKTNLLTRFTRDQFSLTLRNTVGFNSDQKTLLIDNKAIRAEIWDTAGQERYRSMSQNFYRGAVGALIVYDITNLESFNNLSKWIRELKNNADSIVATLIIGNKSDKPDRTVSIEVANAFATKYQCGLIETSAMDSINVEKAFETILKEIVQTVIKMPETVDTKYSFKGKTQKIDKNFNESIHQNKKCLCCCAN
jgi:Ras-related protein Rab-11A